MTAAPAHRRGGGPARLLLALAALGVLLSGCGINRQLAREATGIVTADRPDALDCRAADHCAIASPYQRLAATARIDDQPGQPVHFVDVLEQGEPSLLLRIHLIRAARHTIDIQTFIWAEDASGWLVLDELIDAARRGVRVRVLCDQLFSLNDVDWLARLARAHVNFEFRLYNPTFDNAVTHPIEFAASIVCCFSRFNQRMHNKLFLVDGQLGIAGGRNYEDRYFDWDQQFDYRDRDVLVIGPQAGREMQASFDAFWRSKRAVQLTRLNDVNRRIVADAGKAPGLKPLPDGDFARIGALRAQASDIDWIARHLMADIVRVARVEYFSDTPDKPITPDAKGAEQLSERIEKLFAATQTQLVMQTPYLVISRDAQRTFRALHRRNPELRVIVSTNSLASTDAFYVYALSHKYKKRYLKRLHFLIYELKPFPGDAADMITGYAQLSGGANTGRYQRYGATPLEHGGVRVGMHSKSIVIDGAITLIGSHNFDPRSDHYNTESGFIIHDRTVAERVRAAILRDIEPQNSWVVAKRPRPRLIERINGAIADFSTALPLFDFWPFRYASSFELDPGCQPLLPSDPHFYDCYTDVGDFPGVALPLKTIYTRIATAFGAGLVGIL